MPLTLKRSYLRNDYSTPVPLGTKVGAVHTDLQLPFRTIYEDKAMNFVFLFRWIDYGGAA